MSIKVKHAVIHTAEVGIKVVRIDNKGITQAIFKQIPEKCPYGIDERGLIEEVGEIWGWINYTFPTSPEWAKGYLIWTDGTELFKFPFATDKGWEQFQEHVSKSLVILQNAEKVDCNWDGINYENFWDAIPSIFEYYCLNVIDIDDHYQQLYIAR